MRALLCALLLIGVAAHAQTPPRPKIDIGETCEKAKTMHPAPESPGASRVAALKDPIICLVEVTTASYSLCQVMSKLELDGARGDAELARLMGSSTAPPLPKLECIDEALDTAGAAYRKALAGAAKNREKTALLKSYYGAWRAAMSEIRPEMGEVIIDYNRRQASTGAALQAQAERLKLE